MYPLKYILGGASGFAVYLLYFAYDRTFGLYGSLYYFMLAWIVLLDPTLCMGVAMLRGAQKYVGAYLGMAHKLAWCISCHGA